MSGKYDPPDKARLLAEFRRESRRDPSTVELAVAAAGAQFPPKVRTNGEASRASQTENTEPLAQARARAVAYPNLKRGRKPVVTPERVAMICRMLAEGETETAACLRAGIGLTAWNIAKRGSTELRERIASARDARARLRHQRHAAALYESQTDRAASRKALKPQPRRQAKWIVRYLTTRVPLHFAAIPEKEIVAACERCGLSRETWDRQSRTFGLLRKVYANRAKIRGEQPPIPTANFFAAQPERQDNDELGNGY